MSEWDNTPLPTDKKQLQKWYENKIRAYAHQASIVDGRRKEQVVEQLLDVILRMAEYQIIVSMEVFQCIGGAAPELSAWTFAANEHFIEIHKAETGGPFAGNPIYVVGKRLFDKADEVVNVLRLQMYDGRGGSPSSSGE